VLWCWYFFRHLTMRLRRRGARGTCPVQNGRWGAAPRVYRPYLPCLSSRKKQQPNHEEMGSDRGALADEGRGAGASGWELCQQSMRYLSTSVPQGGIAGDKIRSRLAGNDGALFLWEPEFWVIAPEEGTEGFDDEVVVVALCEAGDGDGSDDSSIRDAEREAATVRRIVGEGQTVSFEEGSVLTLHFQAEGIRAAVEARDDVAFAAYPLGVVGHGRSNGSVEERLTEAANVNYQSRELTGERELVQLRPYGPGLRLVEAVQGQFPFLYGNEGEILGDRHSQKPMML
jgi:hypothetical protein